MRMGFELTPEQQLAVTVEEHTERIKEVETDLANLRDVIKGNGDPKKSLIWLITDMGTLITSQSTLIGAHYAAYQKHVEEFHTSKIRSPWERMWWSVADHVASAGLVFLLGLALLGFLGYLNGLRLPSCCL